MKIIQGKAGNDSALSYFINQLTVLDKKLHMPLMSVTYGRDVKLREDVSFANQATSYTLQSFATGGTLDAGSSAAGGGIPWVGNGSTALGGVDVNGQIITTLIRPAALALSYTQFELESSQLLGQSLDVTKFDAINKKYQLSADQMTYIGDTSINSGGGLLNKSTVSVLTGFTGSWMGGTTTPAQILADVNNFIEKIWQNTAFTYCPTKLGIPPAQYAYLAATPVTTAGSVSILKFLEDNSIALRTNGKPLEIVPMKWATGRGVGGVDRMVAYTPDYDLVRMPIVPIQGFTPSFRDLTYSRPYAWALGELEVVYPETIAYADGI